VAGAIAANAAIDSAFLLVPAQQIVAEFLATFKEYPPSQKAGSFSLDQVMASLATGLGDK
jgi:arylsulfatase